jgi:hypothetical protein
MKGYLLTSEQAESLKSLNTNFATFIPCDYGCGISVGLYDFNSSDFSAHKKMLESYNLSVVDIKDTTELEDHN